MRNSGVGIGKRWKTEFYGRLLQMCSNLFYVLASEGNRCRPALEPIYHKGGRSEILWR